MCTLQSLFLVGLIPFASGVNSIFSEDVSHVHVYVDMITLKINIILLSHANLSHSSILFHFCIQITGNDIIGPNKRDALRGFSIVVFLVGVSQMLFWTVALFQKLVLVILIYL